MKRFAKILTFISFMAVSQLMTSCLKLDIGDDTLTAYDMSLNYDSVYVMLDDTITLSPVFNPDSVTNKEMFWWSDADSIVYADGNDLIAAAEGITYVRGMSVQHRLEDSCYVYVMPRWEVSPYDYPFEIVVYADVKIGGETPSEDILIGAFKGKEFRGIGKWKEWKGKKYMEIRAYSHYDEIHDGKSEKINFLYYDKKNLRVQRFKQSISFDGETHGTISNLFELSIP